MEVESNNIIDAFCDFSIAHCKNEFGLFFETCTEWPPLALTGSNLSDTERILLLAFTHNPLDDSGKVFLIHEAEVGITSLFRYHPFVTTKHSNEIIPDEIYNAVSHCHSIFQTGDLAELTKPVIRRFAVCMEYEQSQTPRFFDDIAESISKRTSSNVLHAPFITDESVKTYFAFDGAYYEFECAQPLTLKQLSAELDSFCMTPDLRLGRNIASRPLPTLEERGITRLQIIPRRF